MNIQNIKLVPCTVNEYPTLINVLAKTFKKNTQHWFVENVGHIFPALEQSDEEIIKRHFLFKIENEIAGVIGIYPMQLKITNNGTSKILSVGGIGSVCTVDKYQKKGIMSLMLKQATEIMEQENFDISWLVGNRFRYKNHSWDIGGKYINFYINSKDLDRYYCDDISIETHTPSINDINLLDKLYSKYNNRSIRNKNIWINQLNRQNLKWILGYSNKQYAYLVIDKNSPQILLEIQGEESAIVSLLKCYMKENFLDTVQIRCPYERDNITNLLNKIHAGCSIRNCSQFRLINIETTWQKLLPLIQEQIIIKSSQESIKLLNELNNEEYKKLILERVLGFYDFNNKFPNPIKSIDDLTPLNWWLPSIDMV